MTNSSTTSSQHRVVSTTHSSSIKSSQNSTTNSMAGTNTTSKSTTSSTKSTSKPSKPASSSSQHATSKSTSSSTKPLPPPSPPSKPTPPKVTQSETKPLSSSSAKTTVTTSDHKSIPSTPSNGSTITSTITDQADSTFTSPVPATTNGTDGAALIFTPPLVTMLSTSGEPNGSFVTYTHVIANPTNIGTESQAVNDSRFLDNQGAMAGVFVVVGMFAATTLLLILFLLRRRRRRLRRQRWFATIQRPSHLPDPFKEPRGLSSASAADPDMDEVSRDRAPIHAAEKPSLDASSSPPGLNFTGIGSGYVERGHQALAVDPFSDDYDYRLKQIPVLRDHQSSPSFAQSSPSIYPASLPPIGESDSNNQWKHDDDPPRSDYIVEAPPRPPRSRLRESTAKTAAYYPMTPPPSNSSHSYSDPPSPSSDRSNTLSMIPDESASENFEVRLKEQHATKRTLLDVRRRPSHDMVA